MMLKVWALGERISVSDVLSSGSPERKKLKVNGGQWKHTWIYWQFKQHMLYKIGQKCTCVLCTASFKPLGGNVTQHYSSFSFRSRKCIFIQPSTSLVNCIINKKKCKKHKPVEKWNGMFHFLLMSPHSETHCLALEMLCESSPTLCALIRKSTVAFGVVL